MRYRNTRLLAPKDLGPSGTEVIDINIKDIISRISLLWDVTLSKHGMDAHPAADLLKIEVVDGSDVLYSMDGYKNQALCIYDRRCPTMHHGARQAGTEAWTTFGIDFGRYLYDPLLAFDPKKFTNPQLKITWDENVSDTGVLVNSLEVRADVFDEKVVAPTGFLMSKEHWAGAKPTSGYEYIDLPTDYPIRKMLIRAYKDGLEPWYQVDEARIDEDNEKRIPFDWVLEDYATIMKGHWAAVEEQLVCTPDDTLTYYVTPTDYDVCLAAFSADQVAYIYSSSATFKGGKGIIISSAGATTTLALIRGYLPLHCFEFQFGDPLDKEDWYDVTKLGSCRLRLHAGAGAATTENAVILQQLRKY